MSGKSGVEIGGSSMNQSERRQILIRFLIKEQSGYRKIMVPHDSDEQKKMLRSLINIRMAAPVSDEFQRIQDEYLQEENRKRGIVELSALTPVQNEIYLWRGDITRLACGAIVNAANSGMTGCYQPCHNCIDNCIHTYAGMQLRSFCSEMMVEQGYAEPTGQAKITPAYNLPCQYVIHTVGPIVQGKLAQKDQDLLRSCYQSCLDLAEEKGIESIAFCCISTGVFCFPNARAAEIAVETVKEHKAQTGSDIKVVFNVFKEEDEGIYRRLLG